MLSYRCLNNRRNEFPVSAITITWTKFSLKISSYVQKTVGSFYVLSELTPTALWQPARGVKVPASPIFYCAPSAFAV
jgi:hypothetical protein